MKSLLRALLAVLALSAVLPPALLAQPATDTDPWAPLRFMVGSWQGKSTGQPGEGMVNRQYVFVLNQRFLHEKNTSTYPPQEKNKKGEVHEHISYFSYDKARKLLVLRQFHVEGFVNQFALNRELSTANKLVFDSEQFENLSNKWRARETYDVIGPDEFTETFELAGPEKPLAVYSKSTFSRQTK